MSAKPEGRPEFLPPEVYQEVFQRANDAIIIFNPVDEIILEVNPRAEELYGCPRSQLIGMSLKSFTLDVPRGEEGIARVLEAGRYHNFETAHRSRSGTVLAILCSASVIQFQGVQAILSINRDVTGSRRVERELQQQSAHLHALIDENPLGIVVLDRAHRVIACNRAFVAIFQWQEEEILNRGFDEIIAPEELKQEAQSLTHAVTEGLPFHVSTRRRRKDQMLVDVEIHGVPLMIDNQPSGSFGLYQDISERVSLQHQLLESQKLEAVGRLAGGVAHDLNNMMTAVTIHAQLLHAKLPPALQQHTNQICIAIDRASSTVQQLLAFSRKQAAFPRVISLKDAITDSTALLRPLIREELDLTFVPGEPDLHVRMDPSHLAQVLVNLVVNAKDAIPGRGSILVRTSMRTLSLQYSGELDVIAGDYAVIEVLDTGSGMTPEIKARIFEPFFTTKEMGKGTGLGLSTVYGVVKQNKGAIEVWSEVGQGSSFRIFLPLEQPVAREESQTKPESLPRGSETVLLVEDEHTAREAIAEFLENLGYVTIQAANGRDALVLYNEHKAGIELVVSDLIMPHMNGFELAKEVWNRDANLPMIFISGHGDEELRSKLPPGSRLFQKPFRLAHLASSMRKLLDEKSA
ncbi:MAG TPA: PAS domain S-box protein [Candidatus Angelobacter sp.]|nr:PAS domain S-box protein [Candidatus Angelobacter sp.]